MYRPRLRQPFDKVKIGMIITLAGSILSIVSSLVFFFVPAQLFVNLFAEVGYSVDASYFSSLRESSLWTMIGGGISLVGAFVARSNNRAAGVIVLAGSVVAGIYIITLIGGIFIIIGNRGSRPPAAGWGTAPMPMQGTQWTPTNLKRCPECGVQLPMEAKFCANCGKGFE